MFTTGKCSFYKFCGVLIIISVFRDRRENIQVSSTKLVLAILSSCKVSDLYYFIFNLCADHNNCVTRLKLQITLTKFANVAAYLHEDVNFGHHLINVAIDHCFSNVSIN